jgi:hypothetical protein
MKSKTITKGRSCLPTVVQSTNRRILLTNGTWISAPYPGSYWYPVTELELCSRVVHVMSCESHAPQVYPWKLKGLEGRSILLQNADPWNGVCNSLTLQLWKCFECCAVQQYLNTIHRTMGHVVFRMSLSFWNKTEVSTTFEQSVLLCNNGKL